VTESHSLRDNIISTSPAAVFARLGDSRPPTGMSVLFDRAIVMGGGIAGLTAARVLADHAAQVIIVERDDHAGYPRRLGAVTGVRKGLAELRRVVVRTRLGR
jgi:NADPH-dependent 2,4-dienoyl-CoA reductase/sulfur reductase-like enzyme